MMLTTVLLSVIALLLLVLVLAHEEARGALGAILQILLYLAALAWVLHR